MAPAAPSREASRWLPRLLEAAERLPAGPRYAIACALALAGVAGAEGLEAIDAPAIFAPALLVTALCVWLLGPGPGIAASLIGALLIPYAIQRPRFALSFADRADAIGWAAFLATTFAILALGIGLRQARRRAQKEVRRHGFLAEASLALDSPESADDRLQQLANLVVPHLADWCAIDLLEPDGGIRLGAVAHSDPAMVSWALDLRERFPPEPDATTGVPQVLRTGRPELYPVISDEMLAAATRSAEHLEAVRRVGFTSGIVTPLIARDRVLGALTLVTSGSGRRLGPTDLELAEELARRAALSVDLAQLYEEEVETSRRLTSLQRVTAALAGALTLQGVCGAVLGEGGKALGADAGIIANVEGGRLRVIASHGYSHEVIRSWEGRAITAPLPGPDAARTGQAVLLGSWEELEARYPGLVTANGAHQAMAAVPLPVGGGAQGFLGFAFAGRRAFTANDEAFLVSMAQLAGVAMARAGAYDTERAVAQTLQRSLLPDRLPETPGLDVAVRYRPLGDGNEVGGDFYDVLDMDGEILVVIGDVCGKGVEAGALSALARHTLRALAEPGRPPSDLLRELNRAVRRQGRDQNRFLTAAVCAMRPTDDGWALAGCCAGHPFPLIARRDGRVEPLGVPGSLIGPLEEVQLTDVAGRLGAGDALVLHTDGLDEARRDGVLFGQDGLRRLLVNRPPDAEGICEEIESAVVDFRGGALQDDLALVVAVAE